MFRTTLIIDKTTRENLKHIARKDQTYDQLLNELIELKTQGGGNYVTK